MTNFKTATVLPTDCTTISDLASFLNGEESRDREIVNFGLGEISSDADGRPPVMMNLYDYIPSLEAISLQRLEVFDIPKATSEQSLRQFLATHTALAYTPALIGGTERDILVARQGAVLRFTGRMSTFGGPGDPGMSSDEGLALVGPQHFSDFRELFFPGTSAPLGQRLNPETHYIACRWDRNLTPYSFLRKIKVRVRNLISGDSLLAQPIDYGPAEWTGRVADLSPGLAKALKLETDEDVCEVLIPLAPNSATPPGAVSGMNQQREALVKIASRQHSLFSALDEGEEPLRSQILDRYWIGSGFPRPEKGVEEPWSAIFISWCIKQAGASSEDFLFSPRHSRFVHKAIENAKGNKGNFRAFRIDEHAPKLGDLIHGNRDHGNITFEQAAENDDYDSHSAIVVGFGEDSNGRIAVTVGGNEKDSIRRAHVRLNDAGFVKRRNDKPFISIVRTFDST